MKCIVPCPREIRPGLIDLPCEADIHVSVSEDRDGAWLDDYEASCTHTLTPYEKDRVLEWAMRESVERAMDAAEMRYERWRDSD